MAYTNIDFPAEYFDTKLYTGDGTTNQTITGINFKPDFNWIKLRSSAHQHTLTDAVRGLNKGLSSNSTGAETTDYQYGWLSSFNSNGFTTQKGSGIAYNVNQSGETYVSWNWLGANTTVSNTQGSITTTVSANTTSGFSIVSYTGNGSSSATVGHGLGVIPAMIIIKNRSAVSQWLVKHKSLATDYNLQLNVTDAQVYLPSGTGQGGVGNLSSSSTFGFTSGTTGVNNVNNSGSNFIAYCFAEVKGFSKFGSYTGNGSTDGTFVYTGFKPAFVLIKVTNVVNNWYLQDSKRATYNTIDTTLSPSGSNAESDFSTNYVDFLSNGFKLRNANTGFNASSNNYIYMAFAENPFCSSKGIACTAR